MNTIELGETGARISIHGFGGMPLSIRGRPDEATAFRVVDAAIDAGVNFIDTADVYCLDDDDIGHNERLIAAALRRRDDGERILVATKGGLRRPKGAWVCDGRPEKLRDACENSLRALGVDQIFLYQLHAPDPDVMFEKSVEMLARLQDEEKIRHVGLSNVSVPQIDSASTIVRIESVQNRLSPWFTEEIESDVVSSCGSRGITFLAYSPLGGMELAGSLGEIGVMRDIAAEEGCSAAAVCLAWVRAQGSTVVPIPGARTIEHAIDSAKASELNLDDEELRRIGEAEFVA